MAEILKDVPINNVIPYDKNYLSHDINLKHIINSITDLGGYNKVSIGVDENNVLLYGHGTLQALKKLNWDIIPFVFKKTNLTEKQKTAYRIADNSSGNSARIIKENLIFAINDIKDDFNLTDYGLFGINESVNEPISEAIKEPLGKYEIIIKLKNEQELNETFIKLKNMGLNCETLIF